MTPTIEVSGTSPTMPALSLGSPKSTYRLNQIDKIRAKGVGDHVSLPQLVVCGDQSAGKSSALERVTGVPFPRQEGLCTRFPTEIILRHSTEPLHVSASIIPSAGASPDAREKLKAYRRELSDFSGLPGVIEESAALMGIRGYGSSEHDSAAFSPHVLWIEMVGDTGLHLTIVDLPGLISVSGEEGGEKDDGDVRVVAEMVERYLESSRAIIMAVIQAGNDIANQRIVQLARKHDPEGQRTVGIITKPDLINEGAEGQIARLAKNMDSVRLKHGFFLLRNPKPAEIKAGISADSVARVEREFFAGQAWREQNLDAARVGAQRLRLFLRELLDEHIEMELPKVQGEIKARLAVAEEELASMGVERPTVGHIRSFLTGLSMHFYQLARAALDGNYRGPDSEFFKMPGTRLRALIHKANGEYANLMAAKGNLRKVVVEVVEEELDMRSESNGATARSGTQQFSVTKTELSDWVKKVYMDTRGRELPGNQSPLLLEELFHEQSSPWSSLTEAHLTDISTMVSQWVRKAIDSTVREEAVNRQVRTTICEGKKRESERRAKEELGKLLDDEKLHPITYNHYYTDTIQKARQDKQREAIRNGVLTCDGFPKNTEKVVQAVYKGIVVNMDEQASSEALEGLDAYYKVARKTFVDNVCRQVIERHVLVPLPTLFCPTTVSELSDEDLLRVDSEPGSQRARRAELESLAEALRQSLVDLQSSA